MPHDQAEQDAGAARVDAPAAVERDRAGAHAFVLGARLVAVGERRVGARVVAVRWPQARGGHDLAQADRVGLAQRVEEALGFADVRQGLRVTQVGVHVHESDLAPEKTGALGPLKVPLRAPVVRQRPVEQARTVGAAQMLVDEAQVMPHLRGIEQAFQDRVDHRQQAVAHAGRLVARMQQIAHGGIDAVGAPLAEQRVAGEHIVHQQQTQ